MRLFEDVRWNKVKVVEWSVPALNFSTRIEVSISAGVALRHTQEIF